ncbi:alanine--glyoxylate aminotransferase family protein [Caldilinea sp.]|jgi:predicted phosphoserine aminotransferase|uniref:pyridoxal-phosphate-dependent aminotransferase family protein n=1 Tax=Caldilinea sp. TaxID=2293560 RepID=UPI0021DF09B3|nr:alanine--glyoxylate aminotransferase family protein [Caldilinea sp.]GIV70940.1 MAG: aminotransferase [Caldilinea sp.]
MHEQNVLERPAPAPFRHRQRLFIPGPTDVAPEVLAAQTAPMIGHRSDEFEALFAKCEEQLRTLFYTNARVYIVAASGTGLQEAAIRNLVAHRVLCFVNGAFSQRWADVALGCDKEVVRVDIPWNTAVKPEQAAEALERALAHGPVEAITVVHNETSTGVMSPIREIAAAVRSVSPETLVLVDAVSSFSGTRIETDAWGLDVVLTSSQKALAVPPGLALCAVSDRALAKAETVKGRGWYFDFVRLEKALKKSTTPATPAISLMRSLSVQLDRIFAEGVDARFARHARLAERTQRWAVANGFELMAEEGYRSHTLTTVTNTRSVNVKQLNAYLARHDMEISNGYGDYKDKAFRIAHMGEVQEEDLDRLFAAIERYLAGLS